jgi:hypothetical protein
VHLDAEEGVMARQRVDIDLGPDTEDVVNERFDSDGNLVGSQPGTSPIRPRERARRRIRQLRNLERDLTPDEIKKAILWLAILVLDEDDL